MTAKKINKVSLFVKKGLRNLSKVVIDDNVLRWDSEFTRIFSDKTLTDNWSKVIKTFGENFKGQLFNPSNYYLATTEEIEVAGSFLFSGLEYIIIAFNLNKDEISKINTSCYSRRWRAGQNLPLQWTMEIHFSENGIEANAEEIRPYLVAQIIYHQRKNKVCLEKVNMSCNMNFSIPDFLGCKIELMVNGKPYVSPKSGIDGNFDGSLISTVGDPLIENYKNTIIASRFCNGVAVNKIFRGFSSSMGNTQMSLVKGTLLGLSGIKSKSADVTMNGNQAQVGIPGSYSARGDVFIISFED